MRKNRLLRAGFLGTSTVMEMLEANYRTWCAQNDILVEDGPSESMKEATMELETPWNGIEDDEPEENVDDHEETMDIDEPEIPDFFRDEDQDAQAKQTNAKPGSKRNRKGKVATLIKSKVEKVFDVTGLGEKRARMCDEGDFLKLLWAFNQEGIHFS